MTLAISITTARRMKLAGEAAAVAFAMRFDDHGTTHFPFIPAMICAGVRAGVPRETAELFARRIHEHSCGLCAAGGPPPAGGTLGRLKKHVAAQFAWSFASDSRGNDPVRTAARRMHSGIMAATSERGIAAALRRA